MTNLSELKSLAEAATPGPWQSEGPRGGAQNFVYKATGMRRQICRTVSQGSADAELIAACDPQTVLKLVAVVEAAKAYSVGMRRCLSILAHRDLIQNLDAALAQLERSDRG